MAVCASAIQQPDGSYALHLEPSITDVTTCQYVVHTGSEVAFAPLLSMTPNDALVISGAVCALWAIAWGIRQVGHSMKGNENVQDES